MATDKDKRLDDKEPAKGGTEGAQPKAYPAGDSPKPHGDPLKDNLKQDQKS